MALTKARFLSVPYDSINEEYQKAMLYSKWKWYFEMKFIRCFIFHKLICLTKYNHLWQIALPSVAQPEKL